MNAISTLQALAPGRHRDLQEKVQALDDETTQHLIDQADASVAELKDEVIEQMGRLISVLRDVLTDASGWERVPESMLECIYEIVFELKGLAGTFDLPMISEIGEMLRSYLRSTNAIGPHELDVIRHHVAAISVVHRNLVEGDGGATGRRLVEALRETMRQAGAGK
jgi:hypothetical protein